MTNRQIAEKLQISVATVKAHIAALLTITHARNRVRLMQLTGSLDEGRELRLGSPLAADEASVAGH
jgi:predicted ArsR family transcriptional regulator